MIDVLFWHPNTNTWINISFFFVKEIPVLTLTFLINILLEYLEDLLRDFDYLDGKPEVLFFYWCLWK